MTHSPPQQGWQDKVAARSPSKCRSPAKHVSLLPPARVPSSLKRCLVQLISSSSSPATSNRILEAIDVRVAPQEEGGRCRASKQAGKRDGLTLQLSSNAPPIARPSPPLLLSFALCSESYTIPVLRIAALAFGRASSNFPLSRPACPRSCGPTITGRSSRRAVAKPYP